jgi:hypothetical protein
MDDAVRKAAAAAVVEKFQDLLGQRTDAVSQRGEIERRIRNIDRALFDCRAAGRLFGVDIELPEDVRPGIIVRPNPSKTAGLPVATAWRTTDSASSDAKQPVFSFSVKLPPDVAPTEVVVPMVASTALPAGEEPSIRELILLYLKQAGSAGIKAALLRRKVETFLNRQIHYKTIGMSLYRLSKETPPMVRREGQMWSLAYPWAEAKNPGAATPGSVEGR